MDLICIILSIACFIKTSVALNVITLCFGVAEFLLSLIFSLYTPQKEQTYGLLCGIFTITVGIICLC